MKIRFLLLQQTELVKSVCFLEARIYPVGGQCWTLIFLEESVLHLYDCHGAMCLYEYKTFHLSYGNVTFLFNSSSHQGRSNNSILIETLGSRYNVSVRKDRH